MIRLLSKGQVQTIAGILIVDSNRRMVSLNRKFIDMWDVPQQIIVSQNEEKALELASLLVEDANSFLNSVAKLYIHTELEIYDTIKLKDGRMFERHSRPQWLENKNVGRIWRFREITECNCSLEVTAIEKKLLLFPANYQVK
ncbi:MAG TPA: hypothetical protein DEV81_06920 [Cyanobacteria bacterium UBA11049]|nr:hypothetical protein [Cyanobacteria bacterium UBA11049]